MHKTPTDRDPPTDRRSLRTRDALRDALLTLIGERGWDNFAVQDLCDLANIGRSTFYSHYANKDALLVGGFANLQAALQQQSRAATDAVRDGADVQAGWRFTLGLIEHVHEQRKIFRSMIGRRSGYVVQQRFREMVIRLITDELPASTGALPRAAAARWLAAGLVELLSWWIERTPLSPSELAALFDELSQPVLRARDLRPGPSPRPGAPRRRSA